jgi:hypothetical protein
MDTTYINVTNALPPAKTSQYHEVLHSIPEVLMQDKAPYNEFDSQKSSNKFPPTSSKPKYVMHHVI